MLSHDLGPLSDLGARVLLFPVRHHSPTAARLVRELIRQRRPAAALVEGPADFNPHLDQLFLPHRPPLAVYSFVRLPQGVRRGAYYPLCEHSPEWQALQAGREVGAEVRFIDLPWAGLAAEEDEPSNRYSDTNFRRSQYIAALCKDLGVDDFNTLWDTLFELDPTLTVEAYLRRCHHLCGHMRLLEGAGRLTDRRREAFMAAQVRAALGQHTGPILVVTGGYHSVALHARLVGDAPPGLADPPEYVPSAPGPEGERGISLTPYSFERLDSLAGYEAGMPNPGFYQQVWLDRAGGRTDTHRTLLERIVARLRERNQLISAADLIAAETTARGLAALRGHADVWRTDLVDGLTAALVKDELASGGRHPLLEAIHEVLRGGERGALASGTVLPPLVVDIQRQLAAHDLKAGNAPREVELDLEAEPDRRRSRVLHRLRLLEVADYERTAGTDLAVRDDLARVWEHWRITWSPDFDARCIEAARYGPSLADAAAARLAERAEGLPRDCAAAALLLLEAALAGLTELAKALRQRVRELIRADSDFFAVTGALGHLLYLFRYDAVLETAGTGEIGDLLQEAYARGLWLLESLGQVAGRDGEILAGVAALRETFERCAAALDLERDELLEVLTRVGADRGQGPVVRGAAVGARWSLGAVGGEQVRGELLQFADPEKLGDFLTGLFALAREQVQRQRDLVLSIHGLLSSYGDEQFLEALPALRLAFTYFTPREKHHLALTLRQGLGLAEAAPRASLAPLAPLDPETAARALALESGLFEAVRKYGLRGGEA
jgi:hypothetical protein